MRCFLTCTRFLKSEFYFLLYTIRLKSHQDGSGQHGRHRPTSSRSRVAPLAAHGRANLTHVRQAKLQFLKCCVYFGTETARRCSLLPSWFELIEFYYKYESQSFVYYSNTMWRHLVDDFFGEYGPWTTSRRVCQNKLTQMSGRTRGDQLILLIL